MRKRELMGVVVGAVAGALGLTGSAAAETRPALTSVSIEGSAVVGERLLATFEAAGDPPTTIEYKWRRCKADKPDDCSDIKDAKSATYVVTPTERGFRLRARVKLRNSAGDDEDESFPTAVVTADPVPQPSPSTTPLLPEATSSSAAAPARSSADSAPDVARRLLPFPVVRVKGYSRSHGSRIVLWSVTAPPGATVEVRCSGPGCPFGRRSFKPGLIRPLQRYLPAGVAITIRVTQRGLIGKYTRVVIRGRKAPTRQDACLFSGHPGPRPC
jgi:hypothetical protein